MNLSFYTLFSPIILSNIHCYFNNSFHEFKILKKIIITKMFNVDFHYKFIKFLIICFFNFLSHIYVCIHTQQVCVFVYTVCVCVYTHTYILLVGLRIYWLFYTVLFEI